jgi:hypothetical protein
VRGTTNGNVRGNSKDREARRRWLVTTFRANLDAFVVSEPAPLPACRCYRCGILLTLNNVTVDRIIPGCQGGSYRRGNIRPACSSCNSETGGRIRRAS